MHNTNSILIALVLVFGSGTLVPALLAWKRTRHAAPLEDDELVSRASQQAVEAARGMLDEYRNERQGLRAELAAHQEQINKLQHEKDRLQGRVDELERKEVQLLDRIAQLTKEGAT